jgi:diaminopimelate decarboxylase/aspartate kinase
MICESGDVFGHNRKVPKETAEGDVFVINTAGAYGRSMSSNYNLREPAKEIFLPMSKPGERVEGNKK